MNNDQVLYALFACFLALLFTLSYAVGNTSRLTYEQTKTVLEKYVPIKYDTEFCAEYPDFDAYYHALYNEIVMCEYNMEKFYYNTDVDIQEKFRNILLHEAVHLAQDCYAGIDNRILKVIDKNRKVSKSMMSTIHNNYPVDVREKEIEAWSYYRNEESLELVRRYCNERS